MAKIENVKKALEAINKAHERSAWGRGVAEYAAELVEGLQEWQRYERSEDVPTGRQLEKILLNGADDWGMYSWGGCSLIYNTDIAKRLCNPSELKRTNGGRWNPGRGCAWLNVQARALYQACERVKRAAEVAEIMED